MWERKNLRGHTSEALGAARGKALLETTRAFLDEHGIKRELTLDSPLAEPGLGLDSIQRLGLLAAMLPKPAAFPLGDGVSQLG
jgi:hypothetical protein